MIKTDQHGNTMITGGHVEVYRLLAIKRMVKLEGLGMTRRGRSATAIAKEMLGLKRNTPREEVMRRLTEAADQLNAQAQS